MKKVNFKVKSSSGEILDVNYYECDEPKALVQMLHGMQEHKERYDEFATFLADNGYNVLIHDHLGHGKSVSYTHPLGDMVSFENVIKDVDVVRKSVNFSGKYICFGHSMGSFMARIYSSLYDVDLLIACGTGEPSKLQAKLMKFTLKFCKKGVSLAGIQSIINRSMGKRFETTADWISYDKENQIRYMSDPLCGNPFTKEGYMTLSDIMLNLRKVETYDNCSADKILLIAGADDPVGDYSKGVKIVETKYKNSGKCVDSIIYNEMTHEILNETNKLKVYEDVLEWLNREVDELF